MRRILPILASTLALAATAGADQVVTMLNHNDEVSVLGQRTPAQDVKHEYWFGAEALRYDMGETSIITRPTDKKLFFLNHPAKTYSVISLPFDLTSLVSPEMAPMMEQMMKMMAASTTVTPSDRTGTFAGVACTYSKVDITMSMMQMSMDMCASEDLPIDLGRYRSLKEMQAELAPNSDWMKDLAEKVKGFPIRTDTVTTMMGKSFKSSSELQSIDQRTPPAGFYAPPADYTEKAFDPMAQQAPAKQARKKNN